MTSHQHIKALDAKLHLLRHCILGLLQKDWKGKYKSKPDRRAGHIHCQL